MEQIFDVEPLVYNFGRAIWQLSYAQWLLTGRGVDELKDLTQETFRFFEMPRTVAWLAIRAPLLLPRHIEPRLNLVQHASLMDEYVQAMLFEYLARKAIDDYSTASMVDHAMLAIQSHLPISKIKTHCFHPIGDHLSGEWGIQEHLLDHDGTHLTYWTASRPEAEAYGSTIEMAKRQAMFNLLFAPRRTG